MDTLNGINENYEKYRVDKWDINSRIVAVYYVNRQGLEIITNRNQDTFDTARLVLLSIVLIRQSFEITADLRRLS